MEEVHFLGSCCCDLLYGAFVWDFRNWMASYLKFKSSIVFLIFRGHTGIRAKWGGGIFDPQMWAPGSISKPISSNSRHAEILETLLKSWVHCAFCSREQQLFNPAKSLLRFEPFTSDATLLELAVVQNFKGSHTYCWGKFQEGVHLSYNSTEPKNFELIWRVNKIKCIVNRILIFYLLDFLTNLD